MNYKENAEVSGDCLIIIHCRLMLCNSWVSENSSSCGFPPTDVIYGMRVTTKGRYALRAMINLAMNTDEKPLSIKKITEVEDLSPIFLEQIFTKLKKYGLITSVRGAGGGFRLAKEPDQISVRDILEAVEEGIRLTPCCSSETQCAEDCVKSAECRATSFWKGANDHVVKYFEAYNLQRIINEYDVTNKALHMVGTA
ncbi:MAG: Rrf2 family transcriptional regulator [Spirochaetales bacterium]|nr:Rrf2 family transcriptional regulator [Spirochaetales bacterium]